jgi:hypothetical protein
MTYDDVKRPRSQAMPFSSYPVWLTKVVKTKVADLRLGGRTSATIKTTKKKAMCNTMASFSIRGKIR